MLLLTNTCFGNNINAERVAVLAIYHDSNETITGDMPTPIKYYNPDIEKAYKELEEIRKRSYYQCFPNLVPEYRNLLFYDESSYEGLLVKAADRICAYVKCLEEEKAGNEEFKKAAVATLRKINDMKMPEVDYFFQHFIPGFKLTLDELN